MLALLSFGRAVRGFGEEIIFSLFWLLLYFVFVFNRYEYDFLPVGLW